MSRSCCRKATVVGVAVVSVACTLDLVDATVRPPEPAVLHIDVALDPPDAPGAGARLRLTGSLHPGVSLDGRPRHVADERVRVDGVGYSALPPSTSSEVRYWDVVQQRASNVTRMLRLSFPRVEGLPAPEDMDVLVAATVSPHDSVALGEGEDLVLLVDRPPEAPDSVSWSLRLSSLSPAGFHVEVQSFRAAWPVEVRVPAAQLPRELLPFQADLQMGWTAHGASPGATGFEGYYVNVQSRMRASRKVVAR